MNVNRRNAVAPLELVLALPIILVMLVALVWLGFSVIGQTDVAVQARHDAWSQRFAPWTETPFAFSSEQKITGNASTSIDVTPLLDDFGNPESQHAVAQANWDHRSVDFRSLPNWSLYLDLVVAAKREGIRSQYEDFRTAVARLESIGSASLSDVIREVAASLSNPGRQVDSEGSNRERRLELDRDLEREKRRGRLRDLENEIREQKEIVDELRDSSEPDDEHRRWLAETRIERLGIQRELLRKDE